MSQVTEYSSVAEVPAEVVPSLLQFGLALADTKHLMGRRFSEWVTGAPTMEAAVAAAAITQDELGHARSLFAMLREFAEAPEELKNEGEMQRKQNQAPQLLQQPLPSWFDCVAMLFLLDRAVTAVVGLASDSAFQPLAQRVAKILQEEHFHGIYSKGWVKNLAHQGPSHRKKLQDSIDRFWPVAVQWFGPDDDASARRLVEAGILQAPPSTRLRPWQRSTDQILQEAGLVSPRYEPDWQAWDPQYREARA